MNKIYNLLNFNLVTKLVSTHTSLTEATIP